MGELQKILQNLEKLIEKGQEVQIITLLSTLHPADIADLINALEDDKKGRLFALLDIKTASEVISEIDEISRELILVDLPQEQLKKIVANMESDDATDLLADLTEDKAQKILAQIDKKDSEEFKKLLQYSKDTAGGIMQAELVSIDMNLTVQEAINRIRMLAQEVENFHNIYVTTKDNQLAGVVSLKNLVLAQPDTPIFKIMNPEPISVAIDVDQEEVANIFKKYDFISLPVVDHNKKLVGQILVDDIIDVFEEEASEDILKMAGTSEEELVYGEKIFKISRARLPWLITNLLGGIVTGYLLWLFKITLKDVLALVTFIPVITAMGGNVGIQTSSIMVRGIAIKKIKIINIWEVILKELKVGAVIGLTCGLVTGCVASIWHYKPILGIVVGVAMFFAIIIAAITGAIVPVIFKMLKVDPALASGPFVTTANDITGILIYMLIATSLIKFLI
ncbi:MAG TPA: magnesium transporter [Thermodesulfobacteriota bacterium]|nr:magnesium transporter [Thermodesulfobacteriota bacterium]